MEVLRFILILGVLIIVHEFGHFLAARRLGVKVDKFAIGFGPPIFKRRIKDFDFLICSIPLGGYVKLAGDSLTECKGKSFEYFSKPPGIRAVIVGIGPVFNYILAWLIFAVIFTIGFASPDPSSTIGELKENYPAQASGLKEDDVIVEIDSKKVQSWQELTSMIHNFQGRYLNIKVKRGSQVIDFRLEPRRETQEVFGKKHEVSLIGIAPKVYTVKYPFYEALGQAGIHIVKLTILTLKALFRIFTGSIPIRDSLVGPFGMYVISSDVARLGLVPLLSFVGLISMSLAIFNFLPLPILDGGHLFFLLLEKLRKKPLSPKIEDVINQIGFVFLVILGIFVLYNDFLRFGPKLFGK
ncbi:MAG: RIP metalloprotease RseP [Candidatus Omnitrophica bacterium]|nr:RIP metalloprotease RseP [Candidatus Omnitrophota bacterium]